MASDVLDSEGNFDTSTATAGDAGSVNIAAGSGHSRLEGSILGDALSGFSGGALSLGATKLFLGLVDTLLQMQSTTWFLMSSSCAAVGCGS